MEIAVEILINDREQAGHLLSKKLNSYKTSNTVVVGVAPGGVCVASAIADSLDLPLEIVQCREIKHPANNLESIGSVCMDDVFVYNSDDTPQDYISHQLIMHRYAMLQDQKYYYGNLNPTVLLYKTVILVDDMLLSPGILKACLRNIKKQKPLKIVVAVPVVRAEVARVISTEADDIVFLRMESNDFSGRGHSTGFPPVEKNEARELFRKSKKILAC